MRRIIRWLAYPLVAGTTATFVIVWTSQGWPYWPAFPLLAAIGLLTVAGLERVAPYERAWLSDHGDLAADLAHNLVNLSLLLLTVETLAWLPPWPATLAPWPHAWPVAAQILLAGAILDLGLYAMHRLSHAVPWLWRLHAVHHSAERLYWLNGERRHPLHAVLLAGPGLVVVVALGAPAAVISAWLTLLSVHLAFQHANLDYTLGPLRTWIGGAELHRAHHRRAYENAQVNFGEFWLLWDRLFRTASLDADVRAGDVGLVDRTFPQRYLAQLRWPFASAAEASAAEAATRSP